MQHNYDYVHMITNLVFLTNRLTCLKSDISNYLNTISNECAHNSNCVLFALFPTPYLRQKGNNYYYAETIDLYTYTYMGI